MVACAIVNSVAYGRGAGAPPLVLTWARVACLRLSVSSHNMTDARRRQGVSSYVRTVVVWAEGGLGRIESCRIRCAAEDRHSRSKGSEQWRRNGIHRAQRRQRDPQHVQAIGVSDRRDECPRTIRQYRSRSMKAMVPPTRTCLQRVVIASGRYERGPRLPLASLSPPSDRRVDDL